MKIRVLYFAVFRDKLGREDDVVALPPGSHVRDAIEVLSARHDLIAKLRGRFRVAINQEFARDDRELVEGDELALIPPVAGGSDAPPAVPEERVRHVQLLGAPLSLERCIAAVTEPGMGGIVTFTGMVRRDSHGIRVQHLEYEAYGEMAVREMTRLCDEIEAEIAGCRLAVEHRIGRLEISELAVVIAAAAPHRAEAFAACRTMIDRLKERVPIWKKEVGEDGETWVGVGP
ncbi:MAG TPA: molybdenum cofactor biosynthesis protein MoaE [Kofleriaceae bacterium]|nr:molybdenum cofactor biosynthesis protein MoaE [Kofleriaceae bacterium]